MELIFINVTSSEGLMAEAEMKLFKAQARPRGHAKVWGICP